MTPFRDALQVFSASLRKPARRYGYRGLKIFTSLALRFQDFQRTSSASWTDNIIITPSNSSLLGRTGVLYGSLHRIGNSDLDASGTIGQFDYQYASAEVSSGQNDRKIQSLSASTSFITRGDSIFAEDIPFVMNFTFGASKPISYGLDSLLVANSFYNGWSKANAYYSLSWGGISSMELVGSSTTVQARTASLTPYETVSSYSISSESGVDYRVAMAPVPLPASAWLFGSVVIGLMDILRRKTV